MLLPYLNSYIQSRVGAALQRLTAKHLAYRCHRPLGSFDRVLRLQWRTTNRPKNCRHARDHDAPDHLHLPNFKVAAPRPLLLFTGHQLLAIMD